MFLKRPPGFNPRCDAVGFVESEVALEKVF
jgi:hypothetical protein